MHGEWWTVGYSVLMLTPGHDAPALVLLDQHGETVDIRTFRGRRVLVFFYPKASTPGCTQQVCAVRDVADQVGDTVLIGVSPDLPAAQARFAEKQGVTYPLLSDPDRVACEAWGVWREKVLYGKRSMGVVRSAFLVGVDGVLEQVWYKVGPADTATRLLAALA